MTTIKMLIGAGLAAFVLDAVAPKFAVEEPQTIIVYEQVN